MSPSIVSETATPVDHRLLDRVHTVLVYFSEGEEDFMTRVVKSTLSKSVDSDYPTV